MVVAGSVTPVSVAEASGARALVTGASVGVDSVAGGSVAGMDSEDGGTSGVTLRGELEGWADSEVSGSAEACLAISAESVAGISEVWAGVASVFLAESEAGILMGALFFPCVCFPVVPWVLNHSSKPIIHGKSR